jgi:hypothetical protein
MNELLLKILIKNYIWNPKFHLNSFNGNSFQYPQMTRVH